MGCQGEIYNILGVEVDAEVYHKGQKLQQGQFGFWPEEAEEEGGRDLVYKINGRSFANDEGPEDVDGYNGVPTKYYGAIEKPEFIVNALGNSYAMGCRHFKGKALVGYPVACEAYTSSAVPLPPTKQVEEWKPLLVKEIKEKLDIDVEESDLNLFLLFDFINGW